MLADLPKWPPGNNTAQGVVRLWQVCDGIFDNDCFPSLSITPIFFLNLIFKFSEPGDFYLDFYKSDSSIFRYIVRNCLYTLRKVGE